MENNLQIDHVWGKNTERDKQYIRRIKCLTLYVPDGGETVKQIWIPKRQFPLTIQTAYEMEYRIEIIFRIPPQRSCLIENRLSMEKQNGKENEDKKEQINMTFASVRQLPGHAFPLRFTPGPLFGG
jgi:hypothetical protein